MASSNRSRQPHHSSVRTPSHSHEDVRLQRMSPTRRGKVISTRRSRSSQRDVPVPAEPSVHGSVASSRSLNNPDPSSRSREQSGSPLPSTPHGHPGRKKLPRMPRGKDSDFREWWSHLSFYMRCFDSFGERVRPAPGLRGLYNFGLTCYCNSVLQAMLVSTGPCELIKSRARVEGVRMDDLERQLGKVLIDLSKSDEDWDRDNVKPPRFLDQRRLEPLRVSFPLKFSCSSIYLVKPC